MRTYVSPIGFNTTSIIRSIHRFGVEPGDDVVLLRPAEETDEAQATEAIEDVRRTLHDIEPSASPTLERVPHNDFSASVITCSELIRDAERPVVNVGSGARDVLIPLTVVTVAHAGDVHKVLGFSDIDGQVRELPFPRVTRTPSRGAYETLEVVERADDPVSIADLAAATGRAKSTVARHVTQLEDDGLVTSETNDREKYVTVTLGGKLRLVASAPR